MTQVLVVKPGTLTRADKAKLRRAGVVTVEAAEPQDVKLIETEGAALGGDDMLLAAMQAIVKGGYAAHETFARLCAQYLSERRQENRASQ